MRCIGLTDSDGRNAPPDIIEGFSHRPWHAKVSCSWDGEFLWFEAENDYDPDGTALFDEFWDEVHANINWEGPIQFEIVSSQTLE
jgi:hypothetical protein